MFGYTDRIAIWRRAVGFENVPPPKGWPSVYLRWLRDCWISYREGSLWKPEGWFDHTPREEIEADFDRWLKEAFAPIPPVEHDLSTARIRHLCSIADGIPAHLALALVEDRDRFAEMVDTLSREKPVRTHLDGFFITDLDGNDVTPVNVDREKIDPEGIHTLVEPIFRECCATCRHFEPLPEDERAARVPGFVQRDGICNAPRLEPGSKYTRATNWCDRYAKREQPDD